MKKTITYILVSSLATAEERQNARDLLSRLQKDDADTVRVGFLPVTASSFELVAALDALAQQPDQKVALEVADKLLESTRTT